MKISPEEKQELSKWIKVAWVFVVTAGKVIRGGEPTPTNVAATSKAVAENATFVMAEIEKILE